MKLTFIKVGQTEPTTREVAFIDIKEDSVNTDKGVFFFIDQKDMRFKSCRINTIVRKETDFPIIKLLKDKEV